MFCVDLQHFGIDFDLDHNMLMCCVLCFMFLFVVCILISCLDTGDVLRCMMCFVFQVVLCIPDVDVLMC